MLRISTVFKNFSRLDLYPFPSRTIRSALSKLQIVHFSENDNQSLLVGNGGVVENNAVQIDQETNLSSSDVRHSSRSQPEKMQDIEAERNQPEAKDFLSETANTLSRLVLERKYHNILTQFESLKLTIAPDRTIYSIALRAYYSLEKYEAVEKIYDEMQYYRLSPSFRTIERTLKSCSMLPGRSDKCLQLLRALQKCPESQPHTTHYNQVLFAATWQMNPERSKHEFLNTMLLIAQEMIEKKIEPTLMTFGLLMRVYAVADNEAQVLQLLKQVEDKKFPISDQMYGTLAGAMTAQEKDEEAFKLTRELSQRKSPVSLHFYETWISVVACAGNWKSCLKIRKYMLDNGVRLSKTSERFTFQSLSVAGRYAEIKDLILTTPMNGDRISNMGLLFYGKSGASYRQIMALYHKLRIHSHFVQSYSATLHYILGYKGYIQIAFARNDTRSKFFLFSGLPHLIKGICASNKIDYACTLLDQLFRVPMSPSQRQDWLHPLLEQYPTMVFDNEAQLKSMKAYPNSFQLYLIQQTCLYKGEFKLAEQCGDVIKSRN